MMAVSPLDVAIAAHRAAYDAFQVAPDDEAEDACCAMADALDALVLAACAFPILTQRLPASAPALLDHLRWWLAEEAEYADDYQPNYGILQARAADLAAVLGHGGVKGYAPDAYPSDGPDPILAAITEAVEADAAVDAANDALDEGATSIAHSEVGRRAAAARKTLTTVIPTTLSGTLALARYYARFGEDDEGHGHVVAALLACEFTGAFSPPGGRIVEPDQGVARVIPEGATPDPIHALIAAADAASAAHTAVLVDLDEDDDEQMRHHNAITHASGQAFRALLRTMPTTVAGLHALAAFHLRNGALYDRDQEGVEHLAAALAQVLP